LYRVALAFLPFFASLIKSIAKSRRLAIAKPVVRSYLWDIGGWWPLIVQSNETQSSAAGPVGASDRARDDDTKGLISRGCFKGAHTYRLRASPSDSVRLSNVFVCL
jgi:hypothetical protein